MSVDSKLHAANTAALLALLVGTSVCVDARADEAADIAAARALGVAGVQLADGGNCAQALEKLARAEALHHAPSTAERLGECEIDVGKVVAGTERLQRVVREPLAAGAPAPFVAAVARARSVLEKATARIAMLRVDVKAPAQAHVVVTIDGEPIPDAAVRSERPTDPGSHHVQAIAPGFSPAAAEVVLGDGEKSSIALELQPVPIPRATAFRSPSAPMKDSPPSGAGSPAGAIAAFVLGGAGLAAGALAGLEVMTRSSALSRACDGNGACPASEQAAISSAKTWATVSTTGFAVGGTGLVTGILLLLTSSRTAADSPKTATVAPMVGATCAGLHGWF